MRNILKASIPMVIGFLFHSTFNIVDAYYVGKISPEALAAVSVSFPIVFLIIALSIGVGTGTTSLVAMACGQKKLGKAARIAEHAILLSIIMSFLFTIIGLASIGPLFSLMGVEGEVEALGLEYLTIILTGSIIIFLTMVGSSIIRGEGEMKVPMIAICVSSVINIIIDPIFIFTFGWGVAGAAIATVISRSVGIIIFLAYLGSSRSWLNFDLHGFKFNIGYIKDIFKIGLPSSLSNVSMSLGMFILTVIVAGFGTEALAAFGIGFRLDSLALLPGMGISVAVITLVGQNVGAGHYERAKEMTYKAGLLATGLMTVIGSFLFFFPVFIIGIFNTDPLVIEYGSSFLSIIPFSYLFVGLSMSISGAFLGTGHPLPSFALTFLRAIVLNTLFAVVLSSVYGVSGIWYGIVLSSFMSFLLSVVWMHVFWKKYLRRG
ncbi:MATE family efflux transporter [Candidatus Altiarchaeota archaeon]